MEKCREGQPWADPCILPTPACIPGHQTQKAAPGPWVRLIGVQLPWGEILGFPQPFCTRCLIAKQLCRGADPLLAQCPVQSAYAKIWQGAEPGEQVRMNFGGGGAGCLL